MQLLTRGDHKTKKGEALGWKTWVLYLAPHTLGAKRSLCASSTAACRKECIFFAGYGQLDATKQARIDRSRLLDQHPDAFVYLLKIELDRLAARAKRTGKQIATRLNGTSDVKFERLIDLERYTGKRKEGPLLMYDYTKHRLEDRDTDSLDLTYSYRNTGTAKELARTRRYLKQGRKVAVTYSVEAYEKVLAAGFDKRFGRAYPTLDGDADDLTFLRPGGTISALRAKGPGLLSGAKFPVKVTGSVGVK